jgi:hypothetical protein
MKTKQIGITLFYQLCAHFFKISLIIGSPFLFFSAANCIIPLSGLFGGLVGLSVSYSVYLIKTILCSKTAIFTSFFGFLTLIRLPTLVASLYVFSENALLRTGISLLCITLFLLHPEGMHAPLYTLFWFIPLLGPIYIKNILFFRFLYATLLQHAVGSVLFLHHTSLAAANWNILIPTVFYERLLFAVGMYASYVVISFMQDLVEKKVFATLHARKKIA